MNESGEGKPHSDQIVANAGGHDEAQGALHVASVTDQVKDRTNPFAEQKNISGAEGNIDSAFDRHPEGCAAESCRVIDAVADHKDASAQTFKVGDEGQFVLGAHVAADVALRNARFASSLHCGAFVVAADEPNAFGLDPLGEVGQSACLQVVFKFP